MSNYLLFREDWDKFPTAFPDTQTRNPYFLRFAKLLKTMGVKNHAFCLQLHDKDLIGVNPFEENISLELVEKITIEVSVNPYYYYRECVLAPGGTIYERNKFRANRGNMAMFWLLKNHVITYIEMIRQSGKSYGSDVHDRYNLDIGTSNTDFSLITKDDGLRVKNMSRLKDIEGDVPKFLVRRKKSDISNSEEIRISALKNVYKAFIGKPSEIDARKVGRGITSAIFKFDEPAYTSNIGIIVPAALSAGTTARDLQRQVDRPYYSLLTCTAGKKDERDGRYAYNFIQDSCPWSERLYDCKDAEDLEKLVRRHSRTKEFQVACSFNHRQLGYTDEWLLRAIQDSKSKGDDADRDFFNVWTSGSARSPFNVKTSEIIRASEKDFTYDVVAEPHGFFVHWHIPENKIQEYMDNNKTILGIDTSNASGGDDTGGILTDVETGEVMARFKINESNLIHITEWIAYYWIYQFQNVLVVIENRSSGTGILDMLYLLLITLKIDPFKRLFNTVVQEADDHRERFDEIKKNSHYLIVELTTKYKKCFGFTTSGTGAYSRSDLYGNVLQHAARTGGHLMKDKALIDQTLALTNKNGRVDHEDGEHDDLVIGWLLTWWVMTRGRNLAFYGINSKLILSRNQINKEDNTAKAVYNRNYQETVEKRIEELATKLLEERDRYVIIRLEDQIRHWSSKLDQKKHGSFSVDQLFKSLAEIRKTRNKRN